MRPTDVLTRSGAWLALGCHLLVASGLPLAVPTAGPRDEAGRTAAKDRSRPFPCMDKPCGCATAEQCFSSCCCHTPAQRLAWAKAHNVEAAVVAALERRVATPAAPAGGCCTTAADAAPACCSAAGEPPADRDAPDVCRDYESLAAEPAESPRPDEADPSAPRTVILRDMLACGGIVTAWVACGTALPPPPRVALLSAAQCVGFLPLADVSRPSVSADVPAPPPRVG